MDAILDFLAAVASWLGDAFNWSKQQDWFWPAVAAILITVGLKVALNMIGIKAKPVILVVVTVILTVVGIGIYNSAFIN